jgi:DNA repair exonuclease SbcCD ATPase subunit
MAIVVEVEVGSKQALTSLNGLKTAATQLEDALSGATFGSEEFKRLSNQLKGVRSELKDFDLQLEGLDKEQRATALVDTFTGLTGAVGAVSSAFLAFGASSEKIENAEKKLLGVIGVVNGLRDVSNSLVAAGKLFGPTFTAVGDSIKAGFVAGATGAQTFKAALISTGIGAFIVAVGLLVANFDKLTEALGGASAEQEKFNKAVREDVSKEITQLELLNDTIQDTSLSLNTRQAALDDLKKQFPAYFKDLKDEDILTGKVTIAVDELTDALLAQAKARALQGRIEENTVKQLELEDKLIKAKRDRLKAEQAIKDLENAPAVIGGGGITSGQVTSRGGEEIILINRLNSARERENELNKEKNAIDAKIEADAKRINQINKETDKTIGAALPTKEKDVKVTKEKTDALAEQRKALKSTLDLALATNEAEKAAALSASTTFEERIAIEEDYAKKAITLKEKFAQDSFNATKKAEQDQTALNAELQRLGNERVAAELKTNEDLTALAEQRSEALKAREEAFVALSSQLGTEAANNVLNAIQNQISLVETNTLAGVERLRALQAQLIEQERAAALAQNEQTKQDRLTALQDQLNAELELYKGNEEQIAAIKAQFATQTEAVAKQAADNAVAINADANTQIVENDQQAANAKLSINRATIDASLALANTLVNGIDALAEEGTKAQKAVEISKILISAATSAFQAFAQATALIPPPAGQIVGGILAGVIAAGAAKAIANVNKVQVGGGGAPPDTSFGGGGAASSTIPGGLLTSPTQGNQFGLFGNQTGAPTTGMGTAEGNIPVIKTYVLAGDVTSAQEANAKINQRRKL